MSSLPDISKITLDAEKTAKDKTYCRVMYDGNRDFPEITFPLVRVIVRDEDVEFTFPTYKPIRDNERGCFTEPIYADDPDNPTTSSSNRYLEAKPYVDFIAACERLFNVDKKTKTFHLWKGEHGDIFTPIFQIRKNELTRIKAEEIAGREFYAYPTVKLVGSVTTKEGKFGHQVKRLRFRLARLVIVAPYDPERAKEIEYYKNMEQFITATHNTETFDLLDE